MRQQQGVKFVSFSHKQQKNNNNKKIEGEKQATVQFPQKQKKKAKNCGSILITSEMRKRKKISNSLQLHKLSTTGQFE